MAFLIDSNSTTWIDYRSYVTYYTLFNLSIRDPELWMDVVDFALDDLHSNYMFSGDEYPLQPEFETSLQEKQRKIIVKEWRRALKGWQA
jgi:hypothetical protein